MPAPAQRRSGALAEGVVTAPSYLWLGVFFALPTLALLLMSFRSAGPYGGFGDGWTLDAWRGIANASYSAIVWRTVRLSVVATAICIGLAIPVGYYLSLVTPRRRTVLLLLVIVPFWTNLLIRVFAWKVLLHPLGYLRRALLSVGWIAEDQLLLYNEGAVLLVMAYAYLPFAILPIFAAAEKFDHGLLDAARDLGATATAAFWRVFVPGIRRGVLAAVAMVLIPCLGSYIIPDLVGGPSGEMIGNKIAQRVFTDRNWPNAAALATLLMLITLVPVFGAFLLSRRNRAMPGGSAAAPTNDENASVAPPRLA